MGKTRAYLGGESRQSPRRRLTGGAPLLLIVGTPGTGKRAVGNFLQEHAGFVHIDFENVAVRERYLAHGATELRAELAASVPAGRGIVVTWAAGESEQAGQIRRLESLGFMPIWFDSDRGAACRAHFPVGLQRAPRFQYVDTFEQDGRFKPIERVVVALVAAAAGVRPRVVRDRVPLRSLLSGLHGRLAAGLAIAAGAAAAGAGVLIGNQAGAPGQARIAVAGGTSHARIAALPRRGLLVSGQSLAGIKLGDTTSQVEALWGSGPQLVRCDTCTPVVWFYTYPTSNQVGAGVRFSSGRVVAVFTVGGPKGWHTQSGIKVGQVLRNPFVVATPDTSVWQNCTGYSAKSTMTTPNAVTSILTHGSAVYGFALTRPSVSPCVSLNGAPSG